MKKVVLLRHGESTWNRENRFTGWTDVDLSEKGVAEAARAGGLLRKEGFLFGHAYTSYLKRAVKTLDVVLDKLDQDWIPVSEELAGSIEKAYGMLQGHNKRETAESDGDEQDAHLAPQLLTSPRRRWARKTRATRVSIPVTAMSPRRNCPAPNRSATPSRVLCPTGNARSCRRWRITTPSWSSPTATACAASSST